MGRLRAVAVAAVCAVTLAGCGARSSYDAVTDAMRDWLRAVEAEDAAACVLEAPGVHAELLARHPQLGGPGTSCGERVGRMDSLDLPGPDAAMSVPVWDPSGEALVRVEDDRGGELSFWMRFVDGRWLVAGEAR